MGYFSLDIKKAKGTSDTTQSDHIERKIIPKNADPTRTQTDGKRKYRKKTNSVRLCADDLFNRQTLVAYHDNYARVMAKYGLQRGVRGSEARHTTTMQYYRDLKKKNEVLETETRLLQEKKAEAQEELKQVKAEIRTDKLKNAATDTATALASSVGSLFGSGKMKSLERRNEDLQDRILELENEARQRERQQAKQIQEIRNAYEQQHRKLSEFADFVRRYFPYVEKLMPIINFLRDRLKFNDGIIRRLCEFKEVGIKGELYSSEFNRSFDTRHSVCSIKQDENGKFDFKIDGVSHVNWFRKKMNEFREAIGIPKPRQNRSMKL